MSKFLDLHYYFARLPDIDFRYTKISLALGLLLVIAGFALAYYRRKYMGDEIWKKIIRKYPGMLRTYGLLILLLLLFRETGIPYLAMRFWWFLLGAFFLYHLLKFAFTCKKEYRTRLQQAVKHSVGKQYLPKKKKR